MEASEGQWETRNALKQKILSSRKIETNKIRLLNRCKEIKKVIQRKRDRETVREREKERKKERKKQRMNEKRKERKNEKRKERKRKERKKSGELI